VTVSRLVSSWVDPNTMAWDRGGSRGGGDWGDRSPETNLRK